MNPTAETEQLLSFSSAISKECLFMASNPPFSSSSSSSSSPPGLARIGSDHIISVLLLVPVESVLSFSMTCRRFRSLASSDSLWVPICRREWGGVDALIASFSPQERLRLSWKRLYAQVSRLSSLSCRRLSCKSGDFPTPRASHSLAVVSDWLVLFGGGAEGGRHLGDTWIAYIGNGRNKALSWQHINSGIPSGRFGQTCTLLSNYLVLFGGINESGGRLNDTWIGEAFYEGQDMRIAWRLLNVSSVVPSPRGAHAACSVSNHRMVMHGGIGWHGLRLNDTWILDLSDDFRSGRWHWVANVQSLPPPRSGHTLTWIGGTYMVLFGGRGSGYEVLNDIWLLNIGSGNPEWRELKYELYGLPSEMPLPRVGHSATMVLGRKILIYGGEDSQRHRKDDFWVLDVGALPRFQTPGLKKTSRRFWKKLQVEGHHPSYRSFHGACADKSGRYVYIFGGMIDGIVHPAEGSGLRFNGELYQIELVLQL
ncbi:LOW QUALITY PROTEIN: F-box/kelch-repeat protein At1g51550-like [Curcuma longa]|uniref:LOW QUALITY PROTEIN: F-box/kelch-repeat protein At1g51550-like n=1 Tax=Curcuma longa TaxID=136217 RepID=UPI003D9F39EB